MLSYGFEVLPTDRRQFHQAGQRDHQAFACQLRHVTSQPFAAITQRVGAVCG